MIRRLFCLIFVFLFVLSFVLPVFSIDETNVYHCHDNTSMKIALTFDDGPHPRYTPQILDILQKYNIRATFFLIGENVSLYPELAKRILEEGHEVGNHTFSHQSIGSYTEGQLQEEMEHCERVIYEISEYRPTLFRPPQGRINSKVVSLADDFDYKVILWNIDTRDWAHESPTAIKHNVIKNIRSGSIILMHDFISHNSPTPTALEAFLPILLGKGYSFTVVSDLLGTE